MTATTQEYIIDGMTCNVCVAKVKKSILSIPEISEAEIKLDEPQGRIKATKNIPIVDLRSKLPEAGNYTMRPITNEADIAVKESSGWSVYKPLFLIVAFIAGVSILVQYPFTTFSEMLWMRHFMAGFFIVFSFFKLLNLDGFVNSYQMYDIVAKRFRPWGYVYPFVELGLGLLYLTNIAPFATNVATIVLLGVSSIGVIESNLNKRKIKCASRRCVQPADEYDYDH